ncbi:hypothetical protein [Sporomusa acidovorans]|uniref:Uncharacterized protein n=1 Tax=Sporomusa acidovorans (strain ATCC 49682 / DSM 3132 / Mol) TaxID=1123286 RepID=A0ABZ3J9U7_SPOA4|nr:hypothetical protein [Sporomusa acidovorans]OZC17351.1 hypothetical protein SPACI_38210 [Sporomusa acidovorans DSM 3132]SDF45826.1 hypothetical protein SAMN04488499_105027 [Sporomusa acidovorans]
MKDNSEYASKLNHKQQAITSADKLNTSSDVITNGSVPTGTSGFGAKRIATSEDNNA